MINFLKNIIIKLGKKYEKELYNEAIEKGIKNQEREQEKENRIKSFIETKKDDLSAEHKEIKDLLGEEGKLRKNVDKILKMKQVEKKVQEELNKQNVPLENSINNIILFSEKYIEQGMIIKTLEQENSYLKEKIDRFQDAQLNENLEKGNNNELYQKLLFNSNIKKEELITMFKNNYIYADKKGNAIFPIKNEKGDIIGEFKLDINNIEKLKFCKEESIKMPQVLLNKIFESIITSKVQDKNLKDEWDLER